MSDGVPIPNPKVYQFRIALRDISPLIWWRVLVTNDPTIAFLHEIVQTVMGWEDLHLHQFLVYGKAYGCYREGGLSFADNPRQIRLADFHLRAGERFSYEYDFGAWWCHDIRLERILPFNPKRRYPVCTGGALACPPEDCGGLSGYRAHLDHYYSCKALWQTRKDMAVIAQRVLVFLEGGPRPSEEDKGWRKAWRRMQKRIETDPRSFSRQGVNQPLRHLSEEVSCTFVSS